MNDRTLFEYLYRATFKNKPPIRPSVGAEIRRLLSAAQEHRFVINSEMSAFFADLRYEAWNRVTAGSTDTETRYDAEKIAQMRQAARLPYPVTWIEYDAHAMEYRWSNLLWPPGTTDDLDLKEPIVTDRTGCLLVESGSAIKCIEINLFKDGSLGIFDYAVAWTINDDALPWIRIPPATKASWAGDIDVSKTVASGIDLLTDDRIGQVAAFAGSVFPEIEQEPRTAAVIMAEAEILWAILGAFNDIPFLRRISRTRSTFLGGRIRPPLEYTVVDLNLPKEKTATQVARSIIAKIRKRYHEVRGHPRRFRNELGEVVKEVWVKPHFRGDASLGVIIHDRYDTQKGNG